MNPGQSLFQEPDSRAHFSTYSSIPPKGEIYETVYDQFHTFTVMGQGQHSSIFSRLYDEGGQGLANFTGSLRTPTIATFNALDSLPEGASKREKVRYCAAIIAGVEEALLFQGVEKIMLNTHKTIASLMEEMGWEITRERGTTTDLEIMLQEKGVILPRILYDQ